MPKHTPGPWYISKKMLTAINNSLDDQLYKHIAMVNYYHSGDPTTDVSGEEHQANVNLIATAPELLETLIEVTDKLMALIGNEFDGTKYFDENLIPVINARKIIAKAKGEIIK